MRPRRLPEVPAQTVVVARAAFPKGSLAMRVRDELGEVYADERFGPVFAAAGRPGVSPGRLALVCVLQFVENLTDRQAADAVRGRIDWKYCLGLELTDPGFDFSVLSEFRDRLVAGGLERQMLDLLLARLGELGLVKAGGRQRTDSTHVLAAIRCLNRLELVVETLRAALEALAAAAPGWLAGRIDAEMVRRYGMRTERFRLPGSAAKRQALAVAVGADGYRLLAAVFAPGAPAGLAQLAAVEVARRVWVQQFYPRPAGGDPFFAPGHTQTGTEVIWRDAELYGRPPGQRRLTSPHDPGARSSEKRGTRWEGYKAHYTETCDPGRPRLVTNAETTDATVPDVAMTAQIHAALAAKGLPPAKHLADAGYTSADLLVSSARDHQIHLIGPLQAGRPGGRGGHYGPEAFTIDWDNQHATCPYGITSAGWHPSHARGREVTVVRFPPAACRACPVRGQCTTSTRGRQLTLHPRDTHDAVQAARATHDTTEWKTLYAQRAGAEATIHQATHTTGIRRARYTGLPKTRLEHQLSAAAINLIRLDAWWTGKQPEPTRTTHLARLGQTLAA